MVWTLRAHELEHVVVVFTHFFLWLKKKNRNNHVSFLVSGYLVFFFQHTFFLIQPKFASQPERKTKNKKRKIDNILVVTQRQSYSHSLKITCAAFEQRKYQMIDYCNGVRQKLLFTKRKNATFLCLPTSQLVKQWKKSVSVCKQKSIDQNKLIILLHHFGKWIENANKIYSVCATN